MCDDGRDHDGTTTTDVPWSECHPPPTHDTVLVDPYYTNPNLAPNKVDPGSPVIIVIDGDILTTTTATYDIGTPPTLPVAVVSIPETPPVAALPQTGLSSGLLFAAVAVTALGFITRKVARR